MLWSSVSAYLISTEIFQHLLQFIQKIISQDQCVSWGRIKPVLGRAPVVLVPDCFHLCLLKKKTTLSSVSMWKILVNVNQMPCSFLKLLEIYNVSSEVYGFLCQPQCTVHSKTHIFQLFHCCLIVKQSHGSPFMIQRIKELSQFIFPSGLTLLRAAAVLAAV